MQYKTELHAHCSEVSPCADMSATQVVDRYIRAGYHSLVLTNHLTTPILCGRGDTWDEAIDFFLSPLKIMQERANGRTADIPTNILMLPENHNISIVGSWKKETRFRQERRMSLRCGNASGKSTRIWRMVFNPTEIK